MIIVKDRNKFSFRYMMHLFLLLTFFCIALLSFSNIERSYSPLKYNGPSTLNDLLDHYKEYKTDFKVFVYKTYIFQQGDSKTSKNSFYFLFPVFLGVDLMGGLSFSNLYRVTIVFGLISLLILFLFLKSYWNTYIAFFSCLFYGVSPWFQELFRTETYHGPTVLIALLILYTSFKFIEKKCDDFYIVLPFIIGILIGISYYYYGVIRGLFIFAIIIIAICKENKVKNFFMFFFGIFLVLAWGIYLRLDNGGIFFDEENFLTVSRPLRALIKRNFSILSQIFTPIVDQSSPSEFATHSRLLHPYLFLPFILGFIYSMMQKQRNYRLFKIFSLVIYLSILVTSNCQVRRLTLMIIPIYVFTGIGFFCMYTYIEKIKYIKFRFVAKFLFAIVVSLIVFSNLIYIQNNIFTPERTLGFLRVAQKIKKSNIQGEVLLLMNNAKRSIHEINDDFYIKIENYKKVSSLRMNVSTINYLILPEILSNKNFSNYCLIITPLCEEEIVRNWIKEYGFHISHEEKINISPPLKELAREDNHELINNHFTIININLNKN